MLRAGVEQERGPELVEGLELAGRHPAVLRVAGLQLDDLVHDRLPGALGGGGVAGLPADPGEVEAEGRGDGGLVEGGDLAMGLGLVAGLEGLLLLGLEVLDVVGPPPPAE